MNLYTIVITSVGSKFLSAAKIASQATGRSKEELMEAFEEPPVTLLEDASEEMANSLKTQLEAIGAKVELQALQAPEEKLTVIVTAVGPKAMSVGRLVSKTIGGDLEEVLEALEEVPYTLGEFTPEEATSLKEQLEAIKASVEIKGDVAAAEKKAPALAEPPAATAQRTVAVPEAAPQPAATPKPEAKAAAPAPAPAPAPTVKRVVSESALVSQFEQNWALLEDEASKIKQEKLLPFHFTDIDGTVAERTIEDFDQQLDSLKSEKFTISVCGMVKAGKSTFLNALLFGEDILPAFDTPMTAKLNFIEYTEEKSHFIVNFYDKAEWKELRGSLDEENLSQLDERIQICAEQGYDEDEYIAAPPRKETDLRKLEAYVSDPKSKKGKCTPFVKDVHIFIHNASIRDVRIVDTPGLNDPNVINSRETTKWIKNTHALIFLLPNKGLDESSLKFFDTHLLGTRPSNRVWVINKIDDITDDDLQKTKAYIRQLGQQEEFKQKDLFGREEKICGYSALIAMLKNMYAKGASLNDDQLYHLDNVSEDFNPDPDKLPEVIGDRLYQNIGLKRIIAGFTAINTIYSQHLQIAEKTILNCQMTIEDGQKSDADLQKELEALSERQTAFNSQLGQWKRELATVVFNVVKDEVVRKTEKGLDSLDRKMQLRVDGCTKAEALRGLPYAYRDECTKVFGDYGLLAEGLNDCTAALQDELKMTIKKIKNLFAQNDISGSVNFTALDSLGDVQLNMDDLLDETDYAINDKLPSNWFTELFTSTATMQAAARNVFTEALAKMREKLQGNIKELENKINKQIADSFNEFYNSIENSILQKRSYLESGQEERQKTLEAAKNELEETTARKNLIGDMQRAFKFLFPQEISMNG